MKTTAGATTEEKKLEYLVEKTKIPYPAQILSLLLIGAGLVGTFITLLAGSGLTGIVAALFWTALLIAGLLIRTNAHLRQIATILLLKD